MTCSCAFSTEKNTGLKTGHYKKTTKRKGTMFRLLPGIFDIVCVRSKKSGVEPACGRQAAALQRKMPV